MNTPDPQFMNEEGPTAQRLVFVYGTLRRGGSNDINLREPAPRWVGQAKLAGVLHDLGPYPGLVLGAENSVAVKGEVYAIEPPFEHNLDILEGLAPSPTGEYLKRLLPVSVEGREFHCIVYEINPQRSHGCPVIASGDWIAHWAAKSALEQGV